ncbi:MAG: GNAT family N-acetyltransferase [Pseudolysinimonas sp.]
MAELTLQELTAQTIVAANNLTLKPGQEAFIEPQTYTHAEDKLDPSGSWPRVVLDGDTVVGYIMGTFDSDSPEEYLRAAVWRVEVADGAQGMGVGRFAIQAFADEARARGFGRATVVWGSGAGGPEEFFKAVGFEIVGQTPYGDNLGALNL